MSDGIDPRVGEAVEHVQRAALEMISALRNALDLAENVTRDPGALQSLFSSLVVAARGAPSAPPADGDDAPCPTRTRVERIRVDAADDD